MNKTKKVIILVGSQELTENALEIIKGFKAVTVVRQLNNATVKNVFRHNKNVVFATTRFDLKSMNQYEPVIINCIVGESRFRILQLGTKNIIEDFPAMMDKLDIDVGDHVSNDSTDSKNIKCNCFICKLAEGNPIRPEHILYESQNFLVVPGLGAFFTGYVMIVPKKHVMSFAELNKKEYEEFLRVLNDMRFILESAYKGKTFVFECGSGKGGKGKHETSIVHAHMHLSVTNMPVLEEVHKSGLYPAPIEPKDLIRDYGQHPYMLYIDQDDNWYITSDPETYFPRQHPRQVLADYMGLKKGEYNWRKYPHEEKLDTIAEEIYSFLKKEFDSLPIWIQSATKKFL